MGLQTVFVAISSLSLIGCESDTGVPQLQVSSIKIWSMPADGSAIPAPRSMNVAPDDTVYVLDTGGRILVYEPGGTLVRQWKMPSYDIGKPEGLCVFKDGRIAVADTHYHQVVLFTKNGEVESILGSHGEADGQFDWPVAVAQDDDENFYVSQYGGDNRIQKFSVDGKFILRFGGEGTENGKFMRPSGILWYDDKLYIVDAFNNRIQLFSDDGEFLEILGESAESEQTATLHYPYDITMSVDHEIYVVEYGGNRISRLDLNGKIIGRYGSVGFEDGQFSTPWGLTIDSKNRLLVADTGNRRIVELRLKP